MPTIDAEAMLVDPDDMRDGLTTTVARDDVETALRLDDPPAFSRGDAQREVAVSWTRDDRIQLTRRPAFS